MASLCKNSSTLNIYSIKSVNNSLNSSVIDDENAPTQLFVDKTTRKCSILTSNLNFNPNILLNKETNASSISTLTKNSQSVFPPTISTNSLLNNNNINSNSIANNLDLNNNEIITSFCWYNYDSNKLLITTNQSINNIRTMSLSEKIALVDYFFQFFFN